MNAGFGSWLFGMSLGASALGGMLRMASGIFIVPILALFGGIGAPLCCQRRDLPLGVILADNPNGTLAFRDELVSLLKNLNREEQVSARGFFLTAWNGTSVTLLKLILRQHA